MKSMDYTRVIVILIGIVATVLTFVLGGPLARGNAQAVTIMVTVFSVFAGFTIAIVTLLGDPMRLMPGSWRIGSAHRRQIKRRLHRQASLFYVYLIVLSLAFVASLFEKYAADLAIGSILERLAISIGVGAFIWSVGLPAVFIGAVMERLDEEVRRRREPSESGEIE